jgi:uncharacterized repeat protein (TIGR04138 family)
MEQVIRADGRYPEEAYAFLHEGLSRAVQNAHGAGEHGADQQHVSGEQICLALRDLAIERWGPLARTVLGKWNIHGTMDFGQMVYLLIEHGFMRKTEEDSIADFRDVYDFQAAFAVEEEFELNE